MSQKYVYALKIHNFCKIGITDNILRRINQINSCSPYAVEKHYEILFEEAEKVERILHWSYANKNVHGEWFAIDYADAVKAINRISKHHKTIDLSKRILNASDRMGEMLYATENHN